MSQQRRQKALEKKRRKRKARQLYCRSTGGAGSLFICNPPGLEKMSDVLEDFVDPYLDPNASLEDMRKLLMLGAAAWNAALVDGAAREEFLESLAAKVPEDARADFRDLIEPLIQRKLTNFPDNRRLIADFSLEMRPTGPYLQVASSLPV